MFYEGWPAFPVGIVIATVVSSMGIGGGIFWMPFFLIVIKLPPDKAVFSSLLIQTAGMGSGSLAFFKQKRVDHRLALFLLLFTLPGIAAGAYFAYRLESSQMELIIGLLVMATALLFVSASQKYEDLGRVRTPRKPSCRYGWTVMPMSVISGMLSISLGEWLVPLMRSRLQLKMSSAIATSVFITFGTCMIGAAAHALMGGTADQASVLWGIPGVILGGQIGPRITERIDERLLKEIFIFLLTLVGIHLVYNAY